MKILSTVLLLMFISTPAFAATSIKAEVNGMVCAFCAKGISKKLNALPEGQASYVDLKSRVVALELKDGQEVSLEKFTKIIEEAGYSVSKVDKVQQSVADIKAEATKDEK